MRTYYSIGEVSKMTGFTINSLRHYDKIGLVTPTVVNPRTHYRYYDESQLFLFDIISFAKKIHLPLEELKTILDKKDMNSFKDFLEELKNRMNEQIDALHMNVLDIQTVQEQVNTGEYLSGIQDLYQRNIPERNIVISPKLPDTVNNNRIKQHEALDQNIRENHLTTTFESGTIYRLDDNKLQEVSIYKAITLGFNSDSDKMSNIPAGNYLCITFTERTRDASWKKFLYALQDLRMASLLIIEQKLLNNIYSPSETAYELEVYLSEPVEEG